MEEKKRAAYRQGLLVGLGLAVLTGIEYAISQAPLNLAVFLILISVIKAAVIVYYFMHVYRMWQGEEH